MNDIFSLFSLVTKANAAIIPNAASRHLSYTFSANHQAQILTNNYKNNLLPQLNWEILAKMPVCFMQVTFFSHFRPSLGFCKKNLQVIAQLSTAQHSIHISQNNMTSHIYRVYTIEWWVFKFNKKTISHLTQAQRTPSAEYLSKFLNRARNSRCTVIRDMDTSKQNTEIAFDFCDAILETGPAISMRSELLVAHERLGHLLLLLTV